MKKLMVAVALAVLCGVPAVSRAEVPRYLAAPTTDARTHRGANDSDDASAYAVREQASPQLADFTGGDSNGLYIGTGALLVVLAIVLLVTLM